MSVGTDEEFDGSEGFRLVGNDRVVYARKKFATSPTGCQTEDSGSASERIALPFESWVVMNLLTFGSPFGSVFASEVPILEDDYDFEV
jgi:hypothetical protein